MRLDRAYSLLTVKRVDDNERVIEGTATTPTPDRLGDIVEPLGVRFKNPLPLLWQHQGDKPVGLATFSKPTKDGIAFKAKLPKIDEPGVLKERVDEAWQSVKARLVRGVSIGFRSIERTFIDGGGIRFVESEVLELSLVTVPANAEATITSVKSIDRALRAAAGHTDKPAPGDTGHRCHSQKGNLAMKTFADKIAALEASAAPKRARMAGIMKTALDDDDRELDESEKEEFDELADEVKEIDDKLRRLRVLDSAAGTAKAVGSGDDPDRGSHARAGRLPAEAKTPAEEKGLGFARMVLCFAAAKGNRSEAIEVAKHRYPGQKVIIDALKSPIAGGTTSDPLWAGPLVEPANLVSEFVEFLRPMTIVGKFGIGNVPSLRRVPFNVRIPAQITGGDGYWVGEGQSKKLTRFSFSQIILRWAKVANIAVLTEDLLRFSSPSADLVVRQALAEALQARLDMDFVDPTVDLIEDVRPASVTNGAQEIASAGVAPDAVREDLKALLSFFILNDISPTSGVWIMRQTAALALSLMRNALGQREFPDINMIGGTLEGLPVITSQHVPAGVVALVNASDIYLSDDGGVAIDMSREASLEMSSDPTNAASDHASPPQPAEAMMVSMFQTNSVAIRAERVINWRRRRPAAVAYLTGVGWGNDDDASPAQPLI
jgi:HK97 family phage major capsid protein/HK97 family phage prohead protease